VAKYVISPLAASDLEMIGDYIAQDNPHRAVTFIAELRNQCDKIAASPKTFRSRPELGENIRSSAYGNYVIFFQTEIMSSSFRMPPMVCSSFVCCMARWMQ
jgi:toxin ParE1/3/4